MENWENMSNEELCVLYQDTKNEKIFEYLLERNTGFIISRLRRYLQRNIDSVDDLFQYARISMWSCVKRFDITKGYKLTTYLSFYIKRASNYWERSKDIIRVPAHILTSKAKYNDELYMAKCQSLNEHVHLDDDYDHELIEIAEDPDSEITSEKLDELTNHKDLRKLLSHLRPRYQSVMEWYLGLKDGRPYTLEEIGRKFGVTREFIRQIIVKSVRRLTPHVAKYLDISGYSKDGKVPTDNTRKIYTRLRDKKK